jgi:glycosyltransferase involved in cell wall biosynthesis
MPYSVRDGETGLIVPVGDPRALATAIGNLVSDRDRAAAMGAAARRYVHDRFSTARFREAGHEIMKTAGGLVR